ncbi:MAG: bifunctional riboflavin kinase/FAD synthetase [Bacteroidales bacterium]
MKIYDSLKEFNKKHKTIVTIGNFDGLHRGHDKLLEFMRKEAKKRNAKSVVITFDPLPRKYLFPKCEYSQVLLRDEKIKLFEKQNIDYLIIVPFDSDIANIEYDQFVKDILINKLNMSALIMGFDHRIGHKGKGAFQRVKRLTQDLDFELLNFDAYHPNGEFINSSEIRKHLSNSDIDKANKLLGYNFFINGEVIKGKQIGKKIGFPTANIKTTKYKLLPKDGVYLVNVNIKGENFNAVASIGTNPTIDDEKKIHIEIHILDFDQDIYGQTVEINFMSCLRETKKFKSMEELRLNIKYDVAIAKKYFNNLTK